MLGGVLLLKWFVCAICVWFAPTLKLLATSFVWSPSFFLFILLVISVKWQPWLSGFRNSLSPSAFISPHSFIRRGRQESIHKACSVIQMICSVQMLILLIICQKRISFLPGRRFFTPLLQTELLDKVERCQQNQGDWPFPKLQAFGQLWQKSSEGLKGRGPSVVTKSEKESQVLGQHSAARHIWIDIRIHPGTN